MQLVEALKQIPPVTTPVGTDVVPSTIDPAKSTCTSSTAVVVPSDASDGSSSSSSNKSTGGGFRGFTVVDTAATNVGTADEIDLLATLTHDVMADQGQQPQQRYLAEGDILSSSHTRPNQEQKQEELGVVVPAASESYEEDLPVPSPAPASSAAGADGAPATDGAVAADGTAPASHAPVADMSVGEEYEEGSAEEGKVEEHGSSDTVGSSGGSKEAGAGGGEGGEGDSAVGGGGGQKKKKKKKKRKSNKSGKMTWTGEEDETGRRLTLRANKGGGGVVVEGLSEVLAASDISPVLLEAARAQLAHAVGDPDVDNLIALGYLQVLFFFLLAKYGAKDKFLSLMMRLIEDSRSLYLSKFGELDDDSEI